MGFDAATLWRTRARLWRQAGEPARFEVFSLSRGAFGQILRSQSPSRALRVPEVPDGR